MAEMNCGASGKDPGVTGQCCKKSCQGQIQVQASVQARPQGQTCCRPVCPPRPPAEAAADFLVCIRRQELPAGSVPVRARAAGCVREWIRPGRR